MPNGLTEKGVEHNKYSFKGFTSTRATSKIIKFQIEPKRLAIGN